MMLTLFSYNLMQVRQWLIAAAFIRNLFYN